MVAHPTAEVFLVLASHLVTRGHDTTSEFVDRTAADDRFGRH